MQRIEVHDVDDPALGVYRHLKDRQLKAREGLFIAEGLEVVRRLLRSAVRVHSLLLTERTLSRLRGDISAAEARDPLRSSGLVYVATPQQMERIAGFAIHRGAVACGHRPAPPALEGVIAAAQAAEAARSDGRLLIVVVQNVCDAQNIGLILRNAAAFGVDLVVLGDGSCDPYYRRAVRVSMGNVFGLTIYETVSLARDLPLLRERLGVRLVAAEVTVGATPLSRARRPARAALLFGSEGAGLTAEALALCDDRVMIPMRPGTSSVNVAVAAGIFLNAFSDKQ